MADQSTSTHIAVEQRQFQSEDDNKWSQNQARLTWALDSKTHVSMSIGNTIASNIGNAGVVSKLEPFRMQIYQDRNDSG